MKQLLKTYLYFILILIASCSNNNELEQSKSENSDEINQVRSKKEVYEDSLNNISQKINELSEVKQDIQKDPLYSNAEINFILKTAPLDHIILGTNNLNDTKSILGNILGFNIKNGTKHNNGIENIFVEFEDGSEIEFISVDNPNDNFSKQYDSLLSINKYGFQFAMRVQNLEELQKYFYRIDSTYEIYNENPSFKILAKENIDEIFPVFFIAHSHSNNNTKIIHENLTTGLSAVWLKTNNIRRAAELFSDRGFVLIDTIKVADFLSKTVLLQNDKFSLILIQDNDNGIVGLSVKTKDIEKLKTFLSKKLDTNIKIVENKRGKSISFSPEITKSIWFEFLQEN